MVPPDSVVSVNAWVGFTTCKAGALTSAPIADHLVTGMQPPDDRDPVAADLGPLRLCQPASRGNLPRGRSLKKQTTLLTVAGRVATPSKCRDGRPLARDSLGDDCAVTNEVTMRLTERRWKTLVALIAVLFSALVLAIDSSTGPFIRMPVWFAFPVILVSWHLGFLAGIALAIVLPMVRLTLEFHVPTPWDPVDSFLNTGVLVLAFTLLAFLISRVHAQQRHIRILQGILPICSFCKKIRLADDRWEQMETYISRHSEAKFSHGLCPECAKREYDLGPD
jgi:hypothetical protein